MFKHVHDLKKDLREKGWWEKETPEVSQISFLRNELKRKQTSGEGRPTDTQPDTHMRSIQGFRIYPEGIMFRSIRW